MNATKQPIQDLVLKEMQLEGVLGEQMSDSIASQQTNLHSTLLQVAQSP